MNDPLPITIRTFGLCQECGAVVHDEAKHFEWHVDQLPDDLPELVEDPWQEALEKDAYDLMGEWDGLLRSAISVTADAIVQLDGDWETYLECVLFAAIRVRAMAPEGTEWDKPWTPKRADWRAVLREVLRRLVNADAHRHGDNGREAVLLLRAADSSLHGLWLAAQEGPK